MSDDKIPDIKAFLQAVDLAYQESDQDREMVERALDLTSKELLQRNQNQQHLLNAIPDLCLRLNSNGKILDWNGQTGAQFFWQKLVLNDSFVSGLAFQEQSELQQHLADFLIAQEPLIRTLKLETEHGLELYELRFSPLTKAQLLLMVRNQTDDYLRQQEREQQNRKLLSFYLMAEVMMTSASLKESYTRILDELLPLSQFDTLQIAHYDSDQDSLSIQVSNPVQTVGSTISVRNSPAEKSIRLGQTCMYSIDNFQEPLHQDHRDAGYLSFVCIPLKQADQVIGVLNLLSRKRRSLSADFVPWMNSLAHYLGLLIERKQVELDLVYSKQQAEVANQVKSQFLATMSHELRTPLNSILGFAMVLSRDAAIANTNSKVYLERIHSNGQHLLSLINDILNVTSLDSDQSPDMTNVNVQDLLRQIVKEYRPLMQSKHLDFNLDFSDQPVVLTTDQEKLEQIVRNLLSNAVKFTPDSGTIWLRLIVSAGQSAWIEVEDTGIGISPANQTQVFESFYQVESTYARRFGGTGLGLTLCAELCATLGFQIKLESKSEQGTCVRIFFSE